MIDLFHTQGSSPPRAEIGLCEWDHAVLNLESARLAVIALYLRRKPTPATDAEVEWARFYYRTELATLEQIERRLDK